MSILPYRWKSVRILFTDVQLKPVSLSAHDKQTLLSYTFDGKRVIEFGLCSEFGRKKADAFALKLLDTKTNGLTCEPAEQVFYTAHVQGLDKNALLMRWLITQFGDVTLAEETDNDAAADDIEDDLSVTEPTCLNCGGELNKRKNAKTCSAKCRKALQRKQVC